MSFTFPKVKTDYGVTFEGRMGGSVPRPLPNAIIDAFHAHQSELAGLGIKQILHKNGTDPSALVLEADMNQIAAHRDDVVALLEKIANERLPTVGHFEVGTSHGYGIGWSVQMRGQLKTADCV